MFAVGDIVGEYISEISWKRISAGRFYGAGPKGACCIERDNGVWVVTWSDDAKGHWGERPNRTRFATLARAKNEAIQFMLTGVRTSA